ncbi:MAG TPA: glutamate-cysteine ligase family protein [Polyangiales bacterium]|nr:glutamate-cysteine ligase family protein [Polyangiales bacterium]
MGMEVEREQFTTADYAKFSQRLRENLEALRGFLARPQVGKSPPSIGLEVEMHLVDEAAQPVCVSEAVLRRTDDARCTLEIDAFNFEINTNPVELAGRPFQQLDGELTELLSKVRGAAAESGARVLLAGTPPTLTIEQLRGPVLSDKPRYRTMSRLLRERRGGPFVVNIAGRECLHAECDDLALEGANASLQVHLRAAPADFANIYNAATIAAGPLLAVTGNSPYFDGKCLWEETRIALFKQATDVRADEQVRMRMPARVSLGHGFIRDPVHLFEENIAMFEPLLPVISEQPDRSDAGAAPQLYELRLHQGTVWNWNRAVYDPAGGGHLRLEHRVVASGPTRVDILANAAFTLGLTLAIAPLAAAWVPAFPFAYAERNLYRAAKHGLEAELAWPASIAPSPRIRNARELVLDLVPLAEAALVRHGVEAAEAAQLLAIIRERALTGKTGANAQRRLLARYESDLPRPAALARMVEDYLALSNSEQPVHTWKL